MGSRSYRKEDLSQTYVTPEHWDRSLSIPDREVHTPLKRGDVIHARWSPILLIMTEYQVIGHIPSSQIAPDLTPNWQELDRKTVHDTSKIVMVASSVVSCFFLLGFLTGEFSFWFPTVSLCLALLSAYQWRRTRL
jgi:hypothetical protein